MRCIFSVLLLCICKSYADTTEDRLTKIEEELTTYREINLRLQEELTTHKAATKALEKKVDDQAKTIDQLHRSCFNGNNVTSREIPTG